MRRFRQEQYEKLKDAVYKRRGWTQDGIPKVETVKRLGIDFPEVMEVLRAHGIKLKEKIMNQTKEFTELNLPVSFEDTSISFQHKSDKELFLSYLIF